MTTLVIECEGLAPARRELAPGEYSLGADDANAIVINHPTVSRHHCDLFVQADGQLIVLDVGSTNGTWVANEPVSKAVLAPGQSFQAGAARITMALSRVLALPPRLPAPALRPALASPATASAVAARPPRTFLQELPEVWSYPFRGEAYIYILIVVALGLVETLLPNFLGIVGFVIQIVIGCYLILLWQQIILSTIDGEDRFPDFPQVNSDWRENFSLYLRYVALTWCCFSPVFVYYYAKTWGVPLPGWLLPCGFVFGCLYFPMALLAFLMTDSLTVLSPIFIVRSILRQLPDYLLVAGLFGLLIGSADLLSPFIEPAMVPGQPSASRAWIVFLTTLSGAVALYFLFVWTRLLGLFYRHYKDRLAWI